MSSRARRALALVVLLPLAASAAAAQPPRPRVKLRAFAQEIAMDTLVYARETIAAPAAVAFAAAREAYTKLKIPREVLDSANGQVGMLRLRSTYTLGGQRLSVYFNCGMGLTGSNADSWRLTIALVTFLTPKGSDSTVVGTGAAAQAEDMGGASKDPVACGSTGLLESRIAKLVREGVASR